MTVKHHGHRRYEQSTPENPLPDPSPHLPCKRLQVDEIWSFIYAKERHVPRAKSAPPEAGDVWTWTVICADTKLVPSWCVGDRSGETAIDLMDDLRSRLAERVQITTDGLKAYVEAA